MNLFTKSNIDNLLCELVLCNHRFCRPINVVFR